MEKWKTYWALAVYWSWQIVTKGMLGFIYLAVISEGLRVLVPPLGQKLYRLPGLAVLRDYELTYRLDLAPFFSIFLLVAVFCLWRKVLETVVANRPMELWTKEEWLVFILGSVILCSDAALFYCSMVQMGWGTGFSFPALIATGAYTGVLVFVSYMGVLLHPKRRV